MAGARVRACRLCSPTTCRTGAPPRGRSTTRPPSAPAATSPRTASSSRWTGGITSATGYSWGSTFASSDQTDLLIQEFGIARLLANDFSALARARAFDAHVSATDVTSRFRTFAAYTQGESERRRLSWEARLVSTGDGPWRWVGGAFFNDAGQSGSGRELAPGLTEFSGVTPVLGGRPVSESVE